MLELKMKKLQEMLNKEKNPYLKVKILVILEHLKKEVVSHG